MNQIDSIPSGPVPDRCAQLESPDSQDDLSSLKGPKPDSLCTSKCQENLASVSCKQLEATDVTYGVLLSSTLPWQRALFCWHECQDYGKSNIVTCNATISACEKVGCWQEALGLLKDALGMKGLGTNTISFNATISACEKASLWQLAIVLLKDMKLQKIKPSSVSVNAVISACGNAAEWQLAASCFLAAYHGDFGTGLIDVVSCNGLLSACAKASEWQKALDWLASPLAISLELDVITCNTALNACGGGNWKQALVVLEHFSLQQVECNIISYNAIISACEKASAWQQAFYLLHETKIQQLEPNVITYNAALRSGQSSSQWQQVIHLQEMLDSCGVDSTVATGVAMLDTCDIHGGHGAGMRSTHVLEWIDDLAVDAIRDKRPSKMLS